jgi:hypothetical protein
MNWQLLICAIGIGLALLAISYYRLASAISQVLFCLPYWRKSNFYVLYTTCIDNPDLFSDLAKRPISVDTHEKAMQNFALLAYDYFTGTQKVYLGAYLRASAWVLVLPALLLWQNIGWLLLGYGLGTVIAILHFCYIEGLLVAQEVILGRMLVNEAYGLFGISINTPTSFKDGAPNSADSTATTEAQAAATSPPEPAAPPPPRPTQLSHLFGWQAFWCVWLLLDVLVCYVEVYGFWQNFVQQEHYTTTHAVLASIAQVLFLQIFFAPIYFLVRYAYSRRLRRYAQQAEEEA